MNEENKQELFEKYLIGDLNEEDRDRLQQMSQADDEFSSELKDTKMMISALRVQQKEELKLKYTAMYQAVKEQKKRPYSGKWYYGIAAAVILVITSTLIINMFQTKDNSEVFASYFKPVIVPTTARNDAINDDRAKAINLYISEEYSTAAEQFQILMESQQEDPLISLLLANSFLKLNKTDEAISLLEDLLTNKEVFYREYSHWYLSLAYIKIDKPEESKKLLLKIRMDDMIFKEQANQLLKELN